MRRRTPLLALLLVTLGFAGCRSVDLPVPGAIDPAFPARGDIAALPIGFTDLVEAVRTVAIVERADLPDGVSQVPDRDDAVFIQWIGGMCDRRVDVVVDRINDDLEITISTERDFGGCRMAGITRTLMLELNDPVDASTVAFEVLD